MNEEEKSQQSTDDSPQQDAQFNTPSTDETIAPAETSSETEKPSTLNPQTSTIEDMEVHHHTHHEHGKKNWKSYFWEFLMLFLAVFCGFLAEYKLEHVIEHQREEEFIASMIDDLAKDTVNFNLVINDFKTNQARLNNLLLGYEKNLKQTSADWATDLVSSVKEGYADFYYTDRTLQQLKNSGGLRLIRNKKAAAGIVDYDAAIKDYYMEEKFLSDAQWRYIETMDNMWSYREMFKDMGIPYWRERNNQPVTKNYWTTANPASFEYLYNKISVFTSFFGKMISQLIQTKQQAIDLIILLKKEYNLD